MCVIPRPCPRPLHLRELVAANQPEVLAREKALRRHPTEMLATSRRVEKLKNLNRYPPLLLAEKFPGASF